jgi:phage terminase large subunit
MRAVDYNVTLTERQTEAYDALQDPGVRDVLYGGAKGGGKSWFGCFWAFDYCRQVIERFNIRPTDNPIPLGWIGRKQSTDFSDTTLETWKQSIPVDAWRIKEQAKELIILNRVKINFGGLDRTDDIQKFNSAELGFVFLDQAEECTQDDVGALFGARRRTINGKPLPYKALLTANPRLCWLRDRFVLKPGPQERFVRALPSDNPHLPADYISTLTAAFKHRPELLKAYIGGSWDVFEGDDQVISSAAIQAAAYLTFHRGNPRRFITCDVARYGDDETIIYEMEETDILSECIYGKKDLMHTANLIFLKQRQAGGLPVVIDDTGNGGGVTDRLREMGVTVIPIIAAAKAQDAETYLNLRAEMWMTVGKMFAQGDASLTHKDDELVKQLTQPSYKFKGKRMQILGKDEIKALIGRSPDRADAYVQGLYALAMGMIPRKQIAENEHRKRKTASPWAA